MGNSPSSVEQHVEQARKTGVCSLKEHKLTQVRQVDGDLVVLAVGLVAMVS